jgi:hypothetical protein
VLQKVRITLRAKGLDWQPIWVKPSSALLQKTMCRQGRI